MIGRNGKEQSALYVRNFIFGVEDSVVSTVGLLSGIAIAHVPRETIFLTGAVLVCVEAFSMAAGSFLSEYSAEDYVEQREVSARRPIAAGMVMFFSYFISGFIPLLPYVLFETNQAFLLSIVLSLIALFILGTIDARFSRVRVARNALRMAFVGGIAIAVGVLVGGFLNIRS